MVHIVPYLVRRESDNNTEMAMENFEIGSSEKGECIIENRRMSGKTLVHFCGVPKTLQACMDKMPIGVQEPTETLEFADDDELDEAGIEVELDIADELFAFPTNFEEGQMDEDCETGVSKKKGHWAENIVEIGFGYQIVGRFYGNGDWGPEVRMESVFS